MKRAFSLLELLVVIAIISLLAALIFPVFARAKKEAIRTSCLSNLRQTGVAIGLYEADANGYLPVGIIHRWQNTGPGGVKFPPDGTRDVLEPLEKYAGGKGVMQCPANDHRFVPRWVVNTGDKKGDRLMVPDTSNVLIQCMHHLDKGWVGGRDWETIYWIDGRKGNHIVLRGDLSVGKEDSQNLKSLVMQRSGDLETWVPNNGNHYGFALGVFASEKWPPQWVRLPEEIGLNWGSPN